MGVLKTIRLVVVYSIGLIWLIPVALQVIYLAVTKKGKFFYKKNRTVEPEILRQSKYGEHKYCQLKNVRLHYVESGPADAPELLVMLHGFPEFWYSWRNQITEFNKQYRVVVPDMRGYGGSSKPTAVSAYAVRELVEDVVELIGTLGYERCVLLGHDWGGAVAWTLAANHPALVSRLVILNCPQPTVMTKHFTLKQFLRSWYMFLVNIPVVPEWYFSTGDRKMLENCFTGKAMGVKNKAAFTKEDLEAFKYTFNSMSDFTGPMNYIRAALQGFNMGSYYMRKVPVPVLMVWGTEDGALTKPLAQWSAEFADDYTLRFVEGASHWVQQDQPEVVNQHIWDFITE